jgi:hypothetical protein
MLCCTSVQLARTQSCLSRYTSEYRQGLPEFHYTLHVTVGLMGHCFFPRRPSQKFTTLAISQGTVMTFISFCTSGDRLSSHYEDEQSKFAEMFGSLLVGRVGWSVIIFVLHFITLQILCRSPWPRNVRRGSAAALLELLVLIPLRTWMSVSCECLVLSEVTASGRSLVRRSPTECFVLDFDLEISAVRRMSSHKRKQILYSSRPCGAFLQVFYVRLKLRECSTFLFRCIVR